MLEIKNLSFSYNRASKSPIINNFSHTFPDNGIFVIMGSSGCGKTTLFSLIAGLIKPDSGEIITDAKKIVFNFQEPRLLPWQTALQNVNFVLGGKKDTMEKAKKALSQVGLSEIAELYPDELSGGMQKRVALARALAYAEDGCILLLDEPFSGVDEEAKAELYEIIKSLSQKSLVLLITHDSGEAEKYGDKIIHLEKAKTSS